MKENQRNIRTLSRQDIEEYMENIGEKKFRAQQVYEWLWLKPVQSIDEMSNLSKELRNKLKEDFTHYTLPLARNMAQARGAFIRMLISS